MCLAFSLHLKLFPQKPASLPLSFLPQFWGTYYVLGAGDTTVNPKSNSLPSLVDKLQN